MLLVSGWTAAKDKFRRMWPERVGCLSVPAEGNAFPTDPAVAWACDNGAFKGLDVPKWLRFLSRLVVHPVKPLWVACPDVVGDAAETMRRYLVWSPVLRELGLPVALVLQDGCDQTEHRDRIRASYPDLAAVFVGGTTAFKLSAETYRLTREAHDAGLLVHFGRVNSLRRIRDIATAARSGLCWCDTIDGGSATRWGDTNIPKLVRFIETATSEEVMVLF